MSAQRETRHSLVDALLAATPEVPADVPDDTLIAAATQMVATREAILATAQLAPVMPVDGPAPAPAAKIAELTARQTAWHDALSAARLRLGTARIATGKLRAYRPRQP